MRFPGVISSLPRPRLKFLQNEAELAAVLAHEIAHVSDRHIVKALDIRADDKSMTAMVSKIVGSTAESASVIFYQAVDHALELLFSKGLLQENEFEADEQAVFLTAFAGYDPTVYSQMLARLGDTQAEQRSELNSTHPSIDERIRRVEHIIRAQGLAEAADRLNQARFQQQLSNGGLDND